MAELRLYEEKGVFVRAKIDSGLFPVERIATLRTKNGYEEFFISEHLTTPLSIQVLLVDKADGWALIQVATLDGVRRYVVAEEDFA